MRRNIFTSYIICNRLNLEAFFEPIIDFTHIPEIQKQINFAFYWVCLIYCLWATLSTIKRSIRRTRGLIEIMKNHFIF
ncbi:hypothetical protein V6N11_070989 [Hibiscus sabdariffa]|uniref:Uncharacterized protein n=1 Tax=Hibiscus sabdariffa TaxID=183260 RepID=A0ABR1ZTC7_9ROSI